ncbi:BON domain-containing protein [Nonomuraea sp. K274]|uniref:BON domain-containing protein n=1 Tax=Nonomuraea cypriaca TaxID=1187855 RepID=A0A931EXF9_9ACTN|nr:BON domain-containing protein [Nonomuraea cypriaca]MBF8186200.1 BON domain-containing protein [Nonomuraea cypriaca]
MLRVFTRPAAEPEADVNAVLPDSGAVSFEIGQGVVKLSGRVPWRSQAIAMTEAVRAIEGVIDVTCEVAADEDDLVIVPPLM